MSASEMVMSRRLEHIQKLLENHVAHLTERLDEYGRQIRELRREYMASQRKLGIGLLVGVLTAVLAVALR